MNTEILFGRKPIIEALRADRKMYRIWLTDATAKTIYRSLGSAQRIAEICDKDFLGKLTHRADHQGIAAEAEPFRYADFNRFLDIYSGIILAIDGITDPRNLGATIRSAALLNIEAVIIPRKNSAEITPVVCHTSAGAVERMDVASVPSLLHTLLEMKKRGFLIAGAMPPSSETVDIRNFKLPTKMVLVLGSESGMSKKIISACDVSLSIPQQGDFDSFNVSVAAAILLWELSGRRM